MARLANSVPIHPPATPPSMPDWTPATPLRVVTGYQNIARSFFEAKGFTNVRLLGADGALEAAPLMGSADVILDLVSTGVTLRENNLKQLDGGTVMQSQGILVANRAALVASPALLDVVHELIERLDAHLKADGFLSVVANMRAASADEVAARLLECDELRGLEVGARGGRGVGPPRWAPPVAPTSRTPPPPPTTPHPAPPTRPARAPPSPPSTPPRAAATCGLPPSACPRPACTTRSRTCARRGMGRVAGHGGVGSRRLAFPAPSPSRQHTKHTTKSNKFPCRSGGRASWSTPCSTSTTKSPPAGGRCCGSGG